MRIIQQYKRISFVTGPFFGFAPCAPWLGVKCPKTSKLFKVASTRLNKLLDIANSLESVNGIFVQGNNCLFTVSLNQLAN